MKNTTLILVPSTLALLLGSACGADSSDSGNPKGAGGTGAGASATGGQATGSSPTGGGGGDGGSGGGAATGGRAAGGVPTGPDGGTGGTSSPDAQVPDATPLACSTDNDCTPSGRLCSPTTQTCVRCYEEAHCPTQQACVDSACEPFVTCSSSLDCAGAANGKTICDPATNRCVECASTADCDGTEACVLGRCECADLLNDPDNCGSCGRQCSEGIPCTAGECKGWTACVTLDDLTPDYSCDVRCGDLGAICRTDCGQPEGAVMLFCTEGGYPIEGSRCDARLTASTRCCCEEDQ